MPVCRLKPSFEAFVSLMSADEPARFFQKGLINFFHFLLGQCTGLG